MYEHAHTDTQPDLPTAVTLGKSLLGANPATVGLSSQLEGHTNGKFGEHQSDWPDDWNGSEPLHLLTLMDQRVSILLVTSKSVRASPDGL